MLQAGNWAGISAVALHRVQGLYYGGCQPGSQVANQRRGLQRESSPAGVSPSEWEEAAGYPLAVSGVFGVVSHEGTLLDPALAAQLKGEQSG